ncbi:Erythritol/L-threitol-binding protein [Thalassocella blandensis]|nr:Erythritol/L-threitol-binding protein [Thalassocella blandensis]
MKLFTKFVAAALCCGTFTCGTIASHAATTLTIGTVNNNDMIRMQSLSGEFEKQYPDIKLSWVVLEENILRQRLTTDIATDGGQFDVMTIGLYETPIWGKRGWLEPFKQLPADYDKDDIFPAVTKGLSVDDSLFALPFYAESSMTYYRKDLFEQNKLTMPKLPSWQDIMTFAKTIHKPEENVYGICLRGKAGWGENMALITTMANDFGARWFDEKWMPEFSGKEWTEAIKFYVELLGKYGPPGASSNGFNENLALFNSGKCGMWIDATVAGSFLMDESQSKVSQHVGFALSPYQAKQDVAGWLWSWALAIPKSSDAKEAAKTFILWATSKEYANLVAKTSGIANVPPGVRESTYKNKAYLEAAPFAATTLEAMQRASNYKPTVKPVPYQGTQFVAIPEFQSIATQVGKLFSGALAGSMSTEDALTRAQSVTKREMKRARYYK